jgi:hypothetical protein
MGGAHLGSAGLLRGGLGVGFRLRRSLCLIGRKYLAALPSRRPASAGRRLQLPDPEAESEFARGCARRDG